MESYTLCLVCNEFNPMNYDIAFPNNPECTGFQKNVLGDSYSYFFLNEETMEYTKESMIRTIKVRLSGVVKLSSENDGIIKHKIIMWVNRAGGVFYCKLNSMDKFGRMFVDIIDPCTGESLSEWIKKTYPQNYTSFVQRR